MNHPLPSPIVTEAAAHQAHHFSRLELGRVLRLLHSCTGDLTSTSPRNWMDANGKLLAELLELHPRYLGRLLKSQDTRLAANQGNANAQYNLGNCCANGKGVAQDYVRAHMWYSWLKLAISRLKIRIVAGLNLDFSLSPHN